MRTRLRWNWGYIGASLIVGAIMASLAIWAVDSLPEPEPDTVVTSVD